MAEIEARAKLKPVKRLQQKNYGLNPVALVGFGDSRSGADNLPDFIPIWTLNDAPSYQVERFNRLFELHPIRDLVLEGERFERLKKKQPHPVFMLEAFEEYPAATAYPLDEALAAAFEHIYVGEEHAKYITSTFGYMLIQAVMEGYNPIWLFGFEFLSDVEHKYQAIGAALLIGWAGGKGIDVFLPDGSPLLPPTLYGYEDYRMISQSNLEQALLDLTKQESNWVGKLNVAHAQVVERQKKNYFFRFFNSIARFFARHSDIQEADDARGEAFKQMYMAAGAKQMTHHYIQVLERKQKALDGEFLDQFQVMAADEEEFPEPA